MTSVTTTTTTTPFRDTFTGALDASTKTEVAEIKEGVKTQARRDQKKSDEEERRRKGGVYGSDPVVKNPKYVISLLPTSFKKSPLYVFAKFVAGNVGGSDIEILFDIDELAKEKKEITFMSFSPLLDSALLEAEALMESICKRHGVKVPRYRDIVQNCSHRLFYPFARLTGCYVNQAKARNTDRIVSGRQQVTFDIDLQAAQSLLEAALLDRTVSVSHRFRT